MIKCESDGVCVYSARSDIVASVLGPLGVHERVGLNVLVDAEQIQDGHLERGVQVRVVWSQVLDCGHSLHSLQLPHENTLEEIENHTVEGEISVPEHISDIQGREDIEVADHVLDPESSDGGKDDLEDMNIAQEVEQEAGAPETQVDARGLLERVLALRPVGWAVTPVLASVRCEILPGLSLVLVAREIVILVAEDERHDEGVHGSELGHGVELLGHVAWIVVVGVAWVATTAIFDVGAALILGCNSNCKQSDGTEGKLGHI